MIQTASHLGEKLGEALEQMGDLGRTAGKKFDEARLTTADALTGSASSVRDAGGAIDELAERTAVRLDTSAAYLRRYDSDTLLAAYGKPFDVIPRPLSPGLRQSGSSLDLRSGEGGSV